MLIIDAAQVIHNLHWQETIDSLELFFAKSFTIPPRQHYTIPLKDESDATMLLMPAWISGEYSGVKLINIYPENPRRGLPTIVGTYLLMNASTGEVIAQLDGAELTARRTVCASALASKYLSRSNSAHLLIVGSGRLARYLGFAHQAVRPLQRISIWARNRDNADEVALIYTKAGFVCEVIDDLESGCAGADIISCATMSSEPLISGKWLAPGTHIDLIGAFTPDTREADDLALLRITRDVFGGDIPVTRKHPYVPLGSSRTTALEDPLRVVAYGHAGSSSFNSNLVVLHGVLAGVEVEGDEEIWLITDARTGPGNSGGGYFDAGGRLVAIHTSSIGDSGSALGYGKPVSALPETWRQRIEDEGGTAASR